MDDLREILLKEIGIDKELKSIINESIISDIKKIYSKFNISLINKKIIDDIIIESNKYSNKKIFFSMVFTYIWKNSDFENRNLLFQILDTNDYNGISCLNNEYSKMATLSKYRRSAVKKDMVNKEIIYEKKKQTLPDFSSYQNLRTSLKTISKLNNEDQSNIFNIFFKEVLLKVENQKFNKDILLAELLLCFPHTAIINNSLNMSSLNDFNILDIENINEINRFISYYVKDKQLLSEQDKFRTLSYLSFYINFYLPMSYHLGLTELKPIKKLDEFNGAYYVSTPIPLNKKTPLSFLKFVDIAANIRSIDGINFKHNILLHIREFFNEIISRREVYSISENFSNPILASNIPKINKLKESTKVRMPTDVFWLFLSTSKKVIEIVNTINSNILKGKLSPFVLRSFYINDELNLNYLKGKIQIDTSIKVGNKDIEIENLRKEIFSLSRYRLKNGRIAEIINPMPLIQIAVSLETGLRHQSIQWLSEDFDHKCPLDIEENELYELFIKTDKAKKSSWYSFVSGRVINLLRSAREFKNLLGQKSFNNNIPYDGHGKKWGSYKILFNYNAKNGNPYSDNLYTNRFKSVLCCIEDLLIKSENNYRIYKTKEARKKLSCDITPHSTRVTVVSELVNYLPPEYISKHITGHSAQTVTYYTKYDETDINNFKLKHKLNLNESLKNNENVSLANINTTKKESTIVQSFEKNYKQAIGELGCITLEDKDLNEIITNEIEPRFSFESTHICPFSSICPKIVLEKGINKDCYKCPYAIRSVDHLPALCAKRRELIELITTVENKIMNESISKTNKISLQENRKKFAEELAYYSIIVQMLDNKLTELKGGSVKFSTFKPEALKKELLKGKFKSDSDVAYVLNRLEEVNNFPDLETPEINAKIKYLTTKLLVSSGNLRELMKADYHGDDSSLHAYSLIKTLIQSKQLTQDDLIKISSIDVNDLKLQNKTFLLENKNALK